MKAIKKSAVVVRSGTSATILPGIEEAIAALGHLLEDGQDLSIIVRGREIYKLFWHSCPNKDAAFSAMDEEQRATAIFSTDGAGYWTTERE